MIALLILAAIGLLIGLLLGISARFLRVESDPLVADLEALLPGTQCGQCGFPGCTGAAQALASGAATITLCPPGGKALVVALAERLGVEADLSAVADSTPRCARVHEELCIGCTRCFKVCPTDAVLGAAKQIHAIFREACTACGKCVDACPTEAIVMAPVQPTLATWYWQAPHIEEVKS
jgi:Na+-translocating ferredoxin:NAD+ oxidoreductase subunit B